jgi:putative membrane protein insertion efficiency factor
VSDLAPKPSVQPWRRALWMAGAPVRALLIGAIRLYQLTLSGWLGGQCRFSPTCSEYARGAISSRGAVIGTVLAVCRIGRCNPFGAGGLDPVPARKAPGGTDTYDGVTHPVRHHDEVHA